MNETELDQMLNRWKAPDPSPALRRRVLQHYPLRQPLRFRRPLAWAAAMAVLLAMLALGTEQAQHGALDNFSAGVRQFTDSVGQWFDDMWIAHIVMAFRNSNPKVFVDGELRGDVLVGGSHGGLWVQFPVEGRYWLTSRLGAFRGTWTAARFDGHALEFQSGARQVRVESHRHYGFGDARAMYMLGPSEPPSRIGK